MPMPDSNRTQALRDMIDSLPLTEPQRELAEETIAAISPEEADGLIRSHQSLVATLPAALAAIERVKRARPAQRDDLGHQAAPTMAIPGSDLPGEAHRPSSGNSHDADA